MTTFPTIVYKDGGPHSRPGGSFSWVEAPDEEAFNGLLKNGYYASLPEAIEKKSVSEEASNEAAPTREEIETKATELGIPFRSNWHDATILEKIRKKISELDEEATG